MRKARNNISSYRKLNKPVLSFGSRYQFLSACHIPLGVPLEGKQMRAAREEAKRLDVTCHAGNLVHAHTVSLDCS